MTDKSFLQTFMRIRYARVGLVCLRVFGDWGLKAACLLLLAVGTGTAQAALPEGCTFLEYVTATNSAFVDTGYVPNPCTVIAFKGMYESKVAYGSLFQDYTDNNSVSTRVILNNTDEKSVLVSCCSVANSMIVFSGVATGLGVVITGLLDRASNRYVVNGKSTTTTRNVGTLTGKSVKLHASDCQTRLYYFTVSENGEVVHDFRPCKKGDEVGYADMVTETFHGQADETGTLTAGPDLPPVTVSVTNRMSEAVLSFDGGETWIAGASFQKSVGETVTVTLKDTVSGTWKLFGAPGAVESSVGTWTFTVRDATEAYAKPATVFAVPGGTGAGTGWGDAASVSAAFAAAEPGFTVCLKEGVYPAADLSVNGLVLTNAVTVRGGYAGSGSPGARAADAFSTFDGEDAVTNLLTLAAAAGTCDFSQVVFAHAHMRGLDKTGAASSLTMTGCRFVENGVRLYEDNAMNYEVIAKPSSVEHSGDSVA